MAARIILMITSILMINACANDSDNPIKKVLESDAPFINQVTKKLDSFELQIIYTEVQHLNGEKVFRQYDFQVDTSTYFYPASTVKMPVAFLALEKLNGLKKSYPELNRNTRMVFDSVRAPQSTMVYDSCSTSSFPTVASLIDQVFTISDNNAYNRLYEFLGQDYINKKLYEKGIFTNSRIITRVGVGGFDSIENQYLNPIHFLESNGDTILSVPPRKSSFDFSLTSQVKNEVKGRGYMNKEGEIVMEPFDMSQKNFISLPDLDRSLKHFIYPKLYDEKKRYNISDDDYMYLIETMEKLPRNFNCYQDEIEYYYDSYVKFFMYGDTKKEIPSSLKIKNKVGVAYGYLLDIAHIHDREKNIEFFLSAIIHVNKNRIYNDGIYEYDDIGIPFLAELGRSLYQYNLDKLSN